MVLIRGEETVSSRGKNSQQFLCVPTNSQPLEEMSVQIFKFVNQIKWWTHHASGLGFSLEGSKRIRTNFRGSSSHFCYEYCCTVYFHPAHSWQGWQKAEWNSAIKKLWKQKCLETRMWPVMNLWGQNGHFWAFLGPRCDNFVGAKNSNQLSQRWHNMFNPVHPLFNPFGATGASYVQKRSFENYFLP